MRCVAAGALALWPAVTAAWAQGVAPASRFVERPDADLLLVALRLGNDVLAETLATYEAPGGALVPLGEVARLLELPILVDVARGQADGWFIEEKRRLHLDAAGHRVVVEGRPRAVDPAEVEVHADDIYVHTRALSSWLPLDLDLNVRDAVITVRPREALPVQRRRARQEWSRTALLGQRPSESAFPRLRVPYRLFDGPSVDLVARVTGVPGQGRPQSDYAAYLSAEALFLESNLRVAGTDRERPDFRGSMGRHDPDGRLLGPLRAREFLGGEVFHPGLDLVALPRAGPGGLVSNFPLQRQAHFDRHSFLGELPPGWEVELLRNDDLVGYQQSRPDGRYQFDDVPLLFGLNVFRLVFHGPQGQRRSETRRFHVAEWLPRRGALHYRLVANRPEEGLERASGEMELGLVRSFSLSLAAAQIGAGPPDRRRYARAGLRGFWRWIFAHADYARDDLGGSVVQGGAQTRLGPFGLVLRHAQVDGFASESLRSDLGPLQSRSAARLDTAIPRTFLPRLPITVEATHDRLESGAEQTHVSQRASMFHRGLALSNQLAWTMTDDARGARDSRATGSFLLSRYLQRFAARGELVYDLRPRADLTVAALTLESRAIRDYLVSAGVNRQLHTRQTRYLLGLSKNTGAVGLGVSADYARDEGLSWGASLNVGLARGSRSGGWHSNARAMASTGALSARAFLDANGNGRFDAGEHPLEGVALSLNRAPLPARTRADGTLFAGQLPVHQDVEVALVPETLEDPLWAAGIPGVRIVPRPGRVAAVDFPVVIQGEVIGTVYERRDGRTRESPGIDVELQDLQGRVVKRTRTAYDGFYDLTGIAPGRYRIRVAAEGLASRGLVPPPPRDVVVDPADAVVEGADIVLTGTAPMAVDLAPPVPIAVPPAVPRDAGAPPPPASVIPAPAAAVRVLHAVEGARTAGVAFRYFVQHSAYRDRATAMSEAERLGRELGRPTRVVAADLGEQGLFHRVLVGDFSSAADAHRFRRGTEAAAGSSVGPVHRIAVGAGREAVLRARQWTGGTAYGVQVASYPDRAAAEAAASRLAGAGGQPVQVFAVDLGPRGVWHRVLVVGFGDADSAHAHRERLRDEGREPGPVFRIEGGR